MQLHAECDLTVEVPQACPVVAMLRPRSGEAQWLVSETYRFDPPVRPVEYVDTYGNLCQRFVIEPGSLRIRCSAVVDTDEHIAVEPSADIVPVQDLPTDVMQYLPQSRYCPSDKALHRAQDIVRDQVTGYAKVEAIRAWIHQHIRYEYGVSNETTDALDTLAAGAGVCRDFSHIGITMCRILGIPARMVVGYLHELDPMDLHAWFEAYLGGRWYTFDATQSEPRGGRVVVAYGRDAADVAILSNYGELKTTDMKVSVRKVDGDRLR